MGAGWRRRGRTTRTVSRSTLGRGGLAGFAGGGLLVHGRARPRASAVGAAALLGRGPGGGAAALADAPVVENLHPGARERLPQDPVEIPLMVLDDEDPSAGDRGGGPSVTRRVDLAVVHWTEPACKRDRVVPIAPWAGRQVGQTVTVQAQPCPREGQRHGSNGPSGHWHASVPRIVQARGHGGDVRNQLESRRCGLVEGPRAPAGWLGCCQIRQRSGGTGSTGRRRPFSPRGWPGAGSGGFLRRAARWGPW